MSTYNILDLNLNISLFKRSFQKRWYFALFHWLDTERVQYWQDPVTKKFEFVSKISKVLWNYFLQGRTFFVTVWLQRHCSTSTWTIRSWRSGWKNNRAWVSWALEALWGLWKLMRSSEYVEFYILKHFQVDCSAAKYLDEENSFIKIGERCELKCAKGSAFLPHR